MKILAVSYSLTGNNEVLAKSVAKEFAAEYLKITEPKHRTIGAIVIDMIFNRTPQVQPLPDKIENFDLILFFAPIWMGQVASPLRTYLKHLKTNSCSYAFISISGGADGANPKLADELMKRTGNKPVALIDLHIAKLLPSDLKPVRKDTSAYRINNEDINKLTDTVTKTLKETIPDLN